MEEKDTLGLLAQQKLDEANNNQTLHNLEQNILAKKQIDEAKSLNKNSQGLRYWDRLSAEGTFLKGQEYQTQSNMINKQYADKNAYDTYQRDKNYDPSTLLQTGFAAPNLTLTEQQALSVSKKLNYQDTLANEIERRKQLEGQLQQNQNNFDRLQALMGVEKEKFYNNLNSIDREYERNIEAVRVANLPYQNILEQTNKYMSSEDGRYNTSYWAALQDGATGLLDSFTDLGRGTFHFLLNGSFDDYEPTEWFKRNFGGHYSSQYEAPLSDESWFNKANLKNFIGMGIQSIPEMIGLVASVAISRGLTAPLLAKRIEQLTTLSSKLRTAGKIEQATFVSTLAKILPKVATTATAVGAIEGPRRTLQIAKDRQDVYGGKFSVDSGDYLAGSASAALDLAGMAFWTKGIGTHWNKIASKMAVTPKGDIISNVTSNLPKLAGGVATNIAPSVIAEGGTEFIQTALEMSRIHNIDLTDFIDIMSSDNAKYNGIKHQLLDAAAVGGLMGGAFSFIGQGVKGVQDFKNYQQEKKQLENQKGNAENYFATTAATTTAGVEHMRTFMSSTINNLFKDTPNINETDLKTFKDKTDKLNHTITDKIIQKQKEAELNKESNPEAYQANLEERTHLARAYDKMVMSMAMLAKDLPFKETNELVNNLNNIFIDSKLEPTKLEAEVTNTIASFIQSNPKVQDLFKQIIKDTMNQNAKDLSAFFEQFNIEVAKPKTTETDTAKEASKANVSPEEQAIRDRILKEANTEAKNVFDDFSVEQQKQTTKPKPNYIRKVKPKNKQDIRNLNFKNQLNLENTSPTIQEELGVELDIPKLEIKEKEAKQVLDNIINFLSSSPEGIKLLMEFQSKERNIQEVVTQNIEGIALKSDEEVKEIFKEATDKDIEILKQMSSNINTSTPSNMTISLTEFKERISTLQKLQFKLMNLSLEQATNEYAAFRQQDIEVTTNMINEELDYFTNFFNRNLSDFLYVENLTEEQKDMILKRLYVTSKNLELINSNYAQILKISDADTRVPFDITTNNDEGVIQRIINYILKLVDRLSSLGRMFNASFSQFKFKNKQELELGLKTINTNFKALENNFTALSKELDNFKKVNNIIKENIESSALFLNTDGKTKTFNINGTDLFLTKKSKFNLDKYALILSNLQLVKTTDVMSKLQSIKGKMNEVLEGKYKDTHLSTVSFNQLAKLLSFPNELDENGKIVKQDIDAQEALSLLSQASVIATLRAISKRENDKHNLDSDNYTLISSKSLDSDIIKGIESLLHIDINDKSLQMALSSLGFLLIKESPTNKTLNFDSTAFSEKVYRAIKKVQENPNNVANIINPKYFRFKASTKLPLLTKQITNLITGEHSDPKKREKNILKALNVLQNAIELEANYRKNPDNIKNTYFYYPITKVNAYSMILEQVKIEKNTANNLSEVFLPRTTPIQHKYASKVVNTRNMSQFSVNQPVKNILLEQLGVTLEDIEEVKHITKTNINAFKNEYIAQGNRVNNPNTYNPFFYFPIFNPKNPQEDVKYYRFKDFTKFKSFLSKVGLENSLNSSSAILENSDLSRSLASKIREDNKDIGELLTILLFPDNYHQDFYYEFNEQSQQRLQVKTGLFDIQRNKLLRPLIELKNWYHNGVYYNQQELKTYEQMDNNEKESIVQALALIITNDSYDKPSQFNPETNILEYKFNEEFPTRESIRQALESEEGRAKLIPYLTRRAEELKLNDEPFIELNALLLKQWFENGFKEFNPNNLMIELDGRSTAVFEQAIHSNANPIASKLGLAKGYIETNPIQSMLLTNTKPKFKEKNSVDDVLNALENDYPYGNTIAKAIRAINKDNIEVITTKSITPTTNTSFDRESDTGITQKVTTEPLTTFLTQNPYIDTFLALTDISLYTTKDYLTSSEASKMFKSLRDIAKKFLLPISYGSRIDAVIESTSTDSVYHYLLELMGQQLSNVVSFYNPAKYKNFNLFLQGVLNPKSNILPNIVKNENIRFHITKILENAVNNNLDEHNIGKAFDFYMENTNFITNFHTMGNRLNFEDLIKINNNQMINNQTIGQIKSSLDKITTLNKYSFSEIMDYLVSNGHLQGYHDKNIRIVNLPDKDNAQDEIVETIREHLKKGGFLYDLQYNPSMRNLVNYLLRNPNSYTETRFNNFYILELKQGFMYDALSDYMNSVQMRSNASALKQEIRNLVFKDIIEQELNKTNLSTITQDEYNQAIMNALDRIESYLDNTLVADKVDNTLNPTDSFQLARDSENVTPKDLLKNEIALKTLISQITESYELPFNLETQVITNFTKRGDETTTERINATIHRLAYKSVINIIEHNLEAWVVGNILLETPVNMSIYDAGIVTMKNAKAFQDGWNKYFEEGPKAINLYSLPATLYKEGMNYSPKIIEESLQKSNDKWNNIIKNTNFIYPVDFNNILQGGTEVNPYTNGDLKAYTIKDNPFNDFLNEFIQMNPNSNNFINSFPLYYRLTNEQKNSLKEEYGEDVINNAKHLDTNILMLPDDIVSTPHSKAIGSLYNKLNKNQITPLQFYNELKELYDNGLILPMSFGSKNNSASKNKFIRQAILAISKGFTPNFEDNTNQDKSVLTDYKPLNPANNPLFVKKQLDYTKQETPVSITKEMLDNSERLHKQQTIDSIQNYINSLKGIENTVSHNIFSNIINNLPENIEFLHNPDITSKGMYVQDKNNHYIIIGNNSSPNTLLHEVIHASISNSMNRNTISAKNIISEMNNIMDYVRHKLENDTTLMKELNLLNEDGTTNVVYEEIFTNNDLSEFLAYFLTDKEKVEFLNNEKSKETLKGILPARVSIVGKGFHLLGRLVKGVIRLLSLNNWKNYNSQMTLDETLSNKLIELSNYNIDENYKKYKDKLYVKTLDTLNQAGSDLISLVTRSIFSNIEEYAAKNNLSPEDIKKEIIDFQNEFMNDILNPSARSSSKASYLKLLKPTNIMNPIKRRAIWELLGMLSQTKSSLMFRFISQIFVDFQLMSKNSTTAETLKRAEELSNRITYYMSQQQLGFDLTKSQINKLLETSLGDKYKELKEEERKFKQPTTEELRSDIYNRKQYSRLTQLERDLGGIIYNLKLSDALPFGFNKEVSNNDILELLETTFLSNEVEKTDKVSSSLVETKSALFNLIGNLVDWKSVDDIPTELITYIQNSTEILGYSRLSRQTSRAGFTNVEDIMRKLKDTKFNNIYIALSANIKPNETMSNKEYRIRRENYHNFFNSMRKLTTYQAIKALDKSTQSSEYHRLMVENIKNEFGLTNSISDNFNVLMTSLLTLHSSYNQRNKTINRYKPIDESKIIELQNEYALLNETNGDIERMNEIKEEINRLEAESYNRYNDFRDADFRETYYLDNRVPYAINSEISLKTILPNQDKAYYQYITNNKQINTQEEAINFLYELGYKFIDSNGKTQETYDSDNPNVTMRYDGYNKYEDTRVNIAYLGSSEMSAGNLLSESNLSEEEQNKIRGLATKQMQEELNSLFTNKWEFDAEVFEKSHIEYRPIGNSTKEFRTLTGRLAHNNMTEVDTRISELLANENKEITRNTTIDKVNVDLARALIKDNEIFNKNQLYKNEIKQGNYVKVFDINNPNNIDKEFYSKLSSEALSTFKEVLLSYNKNKPAADQITELYLNPLTTTFLFGFKNSKFSNAITNPKFRKYFNALETTIENLFRENKTNVIIRNPRVVLANGLSNLMSLTGLGYPIDVILDSIEPLQQELRHYKKMQKELFEVENDIIQLQNLEDLNEEEQIELDKLRSKKERLENTMSQSRVHIPMQNGFDTNIIDETLQEPDNFDKIHLELQKYLPESLIKQGNTNILNELLMTSNSDYYQNLQNLNRLGDLIPKILAYEFSLEEGKTQEQALKFAQDYFVNYNIPITSPFLRMIERTGVGFYLKWGLKTQKIAIQTFLNKPASAMMSLAMSNVIAPSLLSPIVGESFLTKGLPLGQSLDISNYFRYGFLFK